VQRTRRRGVIAAAGVPLAPDNAIMRRPSA